MIEHDQEEEQLRAVKGNGAPKLSRNGSRTAPQVSTVVSPMDGELPRRQQLGVQFYRKAREIRRDPTIRLCRELAMAPLLMAEWEYETSPYAPEGSQQLVEEVMKDLRLPLLRSTLCGMTDYGWQPYEIIADQRADGANGIKLKPLLQDVTNILVNADDGAFWGLRQDPSVGFNQLSYVYLLEQYQECFVMSQDVEGTDWYGEPTLKSLEKVYDEGEIINRSARKYDAKVAGTHWVVYYPLGTSTMGGVELDNGEIAKRLLQQAESVGGIVVPRSVVNSLDTLNAAMAQSEASQWKIELLSDKGSGQTAFIERLKYLDALKARAFGFPERAILEGQFGTKAEAEAHADIAVSNLEVRHAMICQQYNFKLVNVLLEWNYGPEARGTVRIKPSPLADDKRAFLEKLYLQLLANPQAFVTEMSAVDMAQLRDRLGLPELEYDSLAAMPYDVGQDPAVPPLVGYEDPAVAPLDYGMSLRDDVDESAYEAEKPTEAQREAGNYKKGHVRIHGLDVCIETPRGARRKPEWPKLPAHYGYIRRTEGRDGDQVDVFVGKHPKSERVFVIDQGDEDKVMLGFKSRRKAVKAYHAAYDDGRKPDGVKEMSVKKFREWLDAEFALAWDESKHPREEAGDSRGGEFTSKIVTNKTLKYGLRDLPDAIHFEGKLYRGQSADEQFGTIFAGQSWTTEKMVAEMFDENVVTSGKKSLKLFNARYSTNLDEGALRNKGYDGYILDITNDMGDDWNGPAHEIRLLSDVAALAFDESQHARAPAGDSRGGEFVEKGGVEVKKNEHTAGAHGVYFRGKKIGRVFKAGDRYVSDSGAGKQKTHKKYEEAVRYLADAHVPPDTVVPWKLAYDPNQPRDPGGEGGGQWVKTGADISALDAKTKIKLVRSAKEVVLDSGTVVSGIKEMKKDKMSQEAEDVFAKRGAATVVRKGDFKGTATSKSGEKMYGYQFNARNVVEITK